MMGVYWSTWELFWHGGGAGVHKTLVGEYIQDVLFPQQFPLSVKMPVYHMCMYVYMYIYIYAQTHTYIYITLPIVIKVKYVGIGVLLQMTVLLEGTSMLKGNNKQSPAFTDSSISRKETTNAREKQKIPGDFSLNKIANRISEDPNEKIIEYFYLLNLIFSLPWVQFTPLAEQNTPAN